MRRASERMVRGRDATKLLPRLEQLYAEALRKTPGLALATADWLRDTLAEIDAEEPQTAEQTAAILAALRWAEAGPVRNTLPC